MPRSQRPRKKGVSQQPARTVASRWPSGTAGRRECLCLPRTRSRTGSARHVRQTARLARVGGHRRRARPHVRQNRAETRNAPPLRRRPRGWRGPAPRPRHPPSATAARDPGSSSLSTLRRRPASRTPSATARRTQLRLVPRGRPVLPLRCGQRS